MSDNKTLSEWLKSYPEHKSYEQRKMELVVDVARLEKEYKDLLKKNDKLQIKIDKLKKEIKNYI